MMFFKSLFKKKIKDEEYVEKTETIIFDPETKEPEEKEFVTFSRSKEETVEGFKEADSSELVKLLQQEEAKNLEAAVRSTETIEEKSIMTSESQVNLFLIELKKQATELLLQAVENKEVTYENFLENNLLRELEQLLPFIEQIKKTKQYMVLPKELEDLLMKMEPSIIILQEKVSILMTTVKAFREKDCKLRDEIDDYTKISNEINEKKLQGETVEETFLKPKLDEVKQHRRDFLAEERSVNDSIHAILEILIKSHLEARELVQVVMNLKEEP